MNKTHVSILQELAMQRKGIPPQYELLPSEGIGTHLPTFHYRVIVESVVADGKARSKKEAKHEAAKNALEKLCTLGIYLPTHVGTPPVSSSPNHSSPAHIEVNAIGALQDLCSENNIPQPDFQLTADIGPPHCREFTMECKLATMTTTASESTKKKAKQLAAQKMLHRLMDTLPEVIAELTYDESSNALTLKSENIMTTYNELHKKKINWGLKISSYPVSLKTIMNEKNLTSEDLWQDTHNNDETDMRNLINKLDLECILEYIENEDNIIASITIDCQPTFVIVEISESKEEAYYGAIHKCFEFLQIMTK